jgi:hypothetical protein
MKLLWSLMAFIGCAPADKPTNGDSDQHLNDSGIPLDPLFDCEVDADYTVTWDGWANGFFANYCRSCHSVTSLDRKGAPAGIDFDTRIDVDNSLSSIWRVVIENETMPIGGGVYPDDLVLVAQYLCFRKP